MPSPMMHTLEFRLRQVPFACASLGSDETSIKEDRKYGSAGIKTALLLLSAICLNAGLSAGEKSGDPDAQAIQRPAVQPIVDIPGLPRVLLIGDSISMGYTSRVRERLKQVANVHRPPTNCGATTKGIAEIDDWVGGQHWDVIHFNFGLHDLRRLDPEVLNVPPSEYEANLRTLVARLKLTGAELIWATTTPVPATVRPGQYPRVPSDVLLYNTIAGRIMSENGILTNDLYTAVQARITELQRPNDVHLNSQGYTVLADRVAEAIRAVLSEVNVRPADAVRIALLEPQVWACDFVSTALSKPMRFLVVLPKGMGLEDSPRPVIYLLHGRGRNENTLLDNTTRERVLSSDCAVVLPRGHNGWYVNAPTIPSDRYADYIDEAIALCERHFPVLGDGRGRAICGWSMGGYGAAYTACRRPGDFAAVASIIGILDFPRPEIPEPGQNYTVPALFGDEPERWLQMNPRHLLPRLTQVPLFVAFAEDAAERQMNEAFIADAQGLGIEVTVQKLNGGHRFPVVEKALPAAFSFLEDSLKRATSKP